MIAMNHTPTPMLRRSLARASGIAAAAAFLVCLAGLLAVGCAPEEAAPSKAPPPVPVTVGTVTVGPAAVTLHAVGHVEAIDRVAVKARIGGELQRVHFPEGARVSAGAILFSIDPRPYQAALDQAEAELNRNRALLTKAAADVERYKDLVARDFVTREQYDQITANKAALEAAVAADEANVETARLDLNYCTIKAPISGRTGNLAVKAGDLIKANADTAMVTINRMRPISVAFGVPQQELPRIRSHFADPVNVVATLPADGDRHEVGRLTFIDNQVDVSTSTILLKATFGNDDEALWPGQFVDVDIDVATEPNRVLCPATAVETGQDGRYVFIVSDSNTVELRPVTVVRADEVQAVIGSGLEGGETVVTDGQLRLVDGAAITVKKAAAGGDDAR